MVPDVSLVELVHPLVPGRAIDLGCGTGRNALWLARRGWEVTGVDGSKVGLTMARDQAAREGLRLTLVEADLRSYTPAPSHFELVVIANIHTEPSLRDDFFARAAAAVAPGGHLYLVGHHVDAFGLAGPPTRELLYSEEQFRDGIEGLTTLVLERREALGDDGSADDVTLVLWAQRAGLENGARA